MDYMPHNRPVEFDDVQRDLPQVINVAVSRSKVIQRNFKPAFFEHVQSVQRGRTFKHLLSLQTLHPQQGWVKTRLPQFLLKLLSEIGSRKIAGGEIN